VTCTSAAGMWPATISSSSARGRADGAHVDEETDLRGAPGGPRRVEGPMAVRDVVQKGEYVAGHDITIDQSIHTRGLLSAWFTLRAPPPGRRELARARRDVLGQVRNHWVRVELERPLARLAKIEVGLAERPDAVDSPL